MIQARVIGLIDRKSVTISDMYVIDRPLPF